VVPSQPLSIVKVVEVEAVQRTTSSSTVPFSKVSVKGKEAGYPVVSGEMVISVSMSSIPKLSATAGAEFTN
jgi:hypothetical protein